MRCNVRYFLLLFSILLLAAGSAQASHFRGGAISWQAQDLDNDGSKDDVVVTVKTAWRRDFISSISLSFTPSGPVATQLSESVVFVGGGESVSTAEYAMQTTVFEVLNLSIGTEYLASYSSSQRISSLQNNANGTWDIQTTIQLANGNLAPNLEFPIIYEVPQKNPDGSTLADWTFDVDALDPNANSVRYRLANLSELGGGSSTNAAGLSIDPTSGLITWSGSGTRTVGLYSGGIIAEDLDSSGNILSKSHVDFILDLRNASELELNKPVQISDSRNEFVEKGTTSTFNFGDSGIEVVALSDAQGALVETTPNTFTFTAGNAGSPLDPGVYPVTFEITDTLNAFTNSYYSINFIIPDPDAPIVSNLQDDRTPYFNPGSVVTIDSNQDASITDTVNTHFNGGNLKLNLSNSDYANETLSVNSVGTGAGQISLSGSVVSYEGLSIGTIDSTLNGVNNILSIDFNSTDATLDAVAALVQQLTYTNSAAAVDRDLTLRIQDSDGLSNFYSLYTQAVSLITSQISAAPTTVQADGSSQSVITVALSDSSSRAFSASGGTVVVSTDLGTLSAVTDNGDGTYTAILTGSADGSATISATVNGGAIVDTATVDLVEPVAPASSTIALSANSAVVDTYTTITVQATNASGGNVPVGGDTVAVSSTLGTVSAVTDNGDGTYTATITNSTTGSATISASINSAPASNTEALSFTPGPAVAANSSLLVNISNATTDDSVSVTVQLVDANGNELAAGGDTVLISTNAGSVTATTDQSDGTYTATLTNTASGAATVSATLNGNALSDTELVNFTSGAASTATSSLTLSRAVATTDDTVTITLQAIDASGNAKSNGGDTVVFNSSAGVAGATTDNGDGTYTASLTSSTPGAATVSAVLNASPVDDTESVTFTIGSATASNTTLVVSTTTPTTDDTVTVTVQAVDAQGNSHTSGGNSVVISATEGSVSSTTDNGDGTYTATLSRDDTGQVTVSAIVNSASVTDTESVTFSAGVAGSGTSTISISETSPTTDDIVEVTLQAFDAHGNPLTAGGDTVILTSTAGSITATTDNGDGTYSASLTSSTTGAMTVGATLNSVTVADTQSLSFTPGAATVSNSVLSVSDANPTTDDTVVVTLQAVDSQGNLKTSGGDAVVFITTIGALSAITDNGDGTYTATLDSTSTGTGSIEYTLNGADGDDTETVTFSVGAADASTSLLLVVDSAISTIESTTVTLQARDQYDNPLNSGGLSVSFTTSLGTLSTPVVDKGDGTYDVVLSSNTSGTANLNAQIGTDSVASTNSVEVLPSVADPGNSTLTASPDGLIANGSSTSTVTLQLVDVSGNFLNTGEYSVLFTTDRGSLSEVVNNDDGTYTATYTSPGILGQTSAPATITSQIGIADSDSAIVSLSLNALGDEDSDGVPNNVEGTTTDTDSDGTLDYLDTDDDNDGIDTIDEGTTDSDDDATPNYLDTDSDNDGVPDIIEADRNDDGDSMPNYLDTDSDNDGVPDAVETNLPALTGFDNDADGIDDALDVDITAGTDANDNGIDDEFEATDSDQDGVPDYIDVDSDNDGIPDTLEGAADTDEDGIPDYLDQDSNNDGVSDRLAADVSGNDSDEDGIADEYDVDNTQGTDENGDGVDDSVALGDLDADGIPDVQDVDIDGDGTQNTADLFPQNSLETADADGDGLGDNEDIDDDNDGYTDEVEAANGTSSTDGNSLPAAVDTDGDLIADSLERGKDSDGDGISDYLEVDSDSDGIYDHIEASLDTEAARRNDADNDGRVDAGQNGADVQLLFAVQDTDGDGIEDYRDLDSDNDGIRDELEAAPERHETRLDDAVDGLLSDAPDPAYVSPYRDADNDAIENFRDLDSDNDDISDLIEGGGIDSDGDGRQDGFIDLDQDGYNDSLVFDPLDAQDTDTDGLRDFIDLDSDQDGLSDVIESSGVDSDRDGRVDEFVDLNGDGWTDVRSTVLVALIDSDGDGQLNYRDLDSDNDGISDLIESGQPDIDGDGVVDLFSDSDGDGIPDDVDVDNTAGMDADNDGIDDRFDPSFSTQQDTDGDGIIDEFDADANGDGLADVSSFGEPGLGGALPDSDNDGIPDFVDQSEDRVHIGLSGSGCSIGSSQGFDPLLVIMAVLAAAYIILSRLCLRAKGVSLTACLLVISAALAGTTQADSNRGLYLGIGAAGSSLKPEVEGTSFTVDDSSSTGWHALLGYRFHRRWRGELDYAELGEATLAPAATLAYSDYNISVLYDLWKSNVFGSRDNLALFGRIGAGKLSGDSELMIVEDSAVQALFGVGVDVSLSQRLALRAEAVSYDEDANRLGLSLLYRFGSRESRRAPELAKAAVPATPLASTEPAMAAAVDIEPAQQTTTLTLVNFGFDSKHLAAPAKAALMQLSQLASEAQATLVVTGHTDNIGDETYNLRLSKVRAESVKQFLIQQGVEPTAINTRGRGEQMPMADNTMPAGRSRNRRVEIQMISKAAK